MDEWRFGKLAWPDVNEAIKAQKAILIPVGSVEQHGPHLPVDTDTFLAKCLADEVAKRSGGSILVAPPIYYSIIEHMTDWPGNAGVSGRLFTDYCTQVALTFAQQGFRTLLFVNGHGCNPPLLEAVVREVVLRSEAKCAAVSWFGLVIDLLQQLSRQKEGSCHAEQFETSVYLHLDSEHVRMERAAAEYEGFHREQILSDYDFAIGSAVLFFDWWSKQINSGVKGDPTVATAETGRILFEAAVERITKLAYELRDLKQYPRRCFVAQVEAEKAEPAKP